MEKYLAVVSAMRGELDPFFPLLSQEREESVGGKSVRVGIFQGIPTLLMSAGVGEDMGEKTIRKVADRFPIGFSFLVGIAGGVLPEERAGDVIIPHEILSLKEGRMVILDSASQSLLHRVNDPALQWDFCIRLGGRIVTVDRVFGPEEKKSIPIPGVAGVDMESFGWADLLRKKELPFLVVRGISDPLWVVPPLSRTDPLEAERFFPKGRKILNRLNPVWWGRKIRFGRDSRLAIRNCFRVVRHLVAGGNLPGLGGF